MISLQEHLMTLVIENWTQKDTQDILKFIKYLFKQSLIDENSEDQIAISIIKEKIGLDGSKSQRTLWVSIREVVNIPQEDYIELRTQILEKRASYMEHAASSYTEADLQRKVLRALTELLMRMKMNVGEGPGCWKCQQRSYIEEIRVRL